jgi:restriction system protein
MRRTIAEAIEMTLDEAGRPLTPQEVHDAILERDRYRFRADDPVHVVRSQLRRRCANLDFPSAVDDARFKRFDGGRYGLAAWSSAAGATLTGPGQAARQVQIIHSTSKVGAARQHLDDAHRSYIESLTERVLDQVKGLDPIEFEVFCAKLLQAYGLSGLETTPASNDHGIDGTGTWDLGTGELDVAFQCKRYGKKAVSRKDIQAFRGSVYGVRHLGIFLTTSRFSKPAREEALRKGVLPLILIDGNELVGIMLDKGFGVETDRTLPVYELDLDTVLAGDE